MHEYKHNFIKLNGFKMKDMWAETGAGAGAARRREEKHQQRAEAEAV